EPTPADVGLDASTLPATGFEANELALELVGPDRTDWGGEAKGLVLARHAVALSSRTDLPNLRASCHDTLAWALFANGRYREALAEDSLGVEEAPSWLAGDALSRLQDLESLVERRTSAEGIESQRQHIQEVEGRIAELESEVSRRTTWRFDS